MLRRRWSPPRALAALSLAGLAALSQACADNESTLFVQSVLAESDDCTVTPDPGALMRLGGTMDVALASEYGVSLLVANHLVARGDENRLRTETSRVHLYASEVEVQDASGNVLSSFSVPIAGFADPSRGDSPGFGVAGTILIDAGTAQAARGALQGTGGTQNLIARVVVLGRTLGGTEVETPPFDYPVTLCYGCLVAFPPEADDPASPGFDCDAAAEVQTEGLCRPGQDEAVPCSLCRGNPACEPPTGS